MGLQNGRDGLNTGLYALVRENGVLEQGIDCLVVELGVGKDLADGRVVGPQQSAQLVFLAVDLLSQVASGAGVVEHAG